MKLVLDTGVLWRPATLRKIAHTAYDVIIPAVVFVERARQMLRDGGAIQALTSLLAQNQFTVEPFTAEHGMRYAARIADDNRWRHLARDAMIAGHVGPDDVLVTTNPNDFIALGLPHNQIVDAP